MIADQQELSPAGNCETIADLSCQETVSSSQTWGRSMINSPARDAAKLSGHWPSHARCLPEPFLHLTDE
jgi:hypothetical protein